MNDEIMEVLTVHALSRGVWGDPWLLFSQYLAFITLFKNGVLCLENRK